MSTLKTVSFDPLNYQQDNSLGIDEITKKLEQQKDFIQYFNHNISSVELITAILKDIENMEDGFYNTAQIEEVESEAENLAISRFNLKADLNIKRMLEDFFHTDNKDLINENNLLEIQFGLEKNITEILDMTEEELST